MELIPIGSNIPKNPPSEFDRDLWRADHGISPDTTLLAYFGFLNSTKGIDTLLSALSLLRTRQLARTVGAEAAVPYRLMMVGGGLGSSDPTNRATADQLDALARKLGVDELLLWTGFLDPQEVSAALLSADMAVLPYADGASFRRGSLLAVLEHELPVITTRPTNDEKPDLGLPKGRRTKDDRRLATDDVYRADSRLEGDAEELLRSSWPSLEHEVNALLVPPSDPQALADAIERLVRDPELRAILRGGARKLALFFGWERIAQRHRELYEALAPEPD